MKHLLLIALILLLGLSSCKKTVVNNYGAETTNKAEDVKPVTGENYTHTDTYIKEHSWKIIGRFDTNNGEVLVWKLQESTGTNNYIIINPVRGEKYYQPNYQLGAILIGNEVILMAIQKQ